MLLVRIYTQLFRFLLWFVLLPLSPILRWKYPRIDNAYNDYFGMVSSDVSAFSSIGGPLYWIHGVSVGEINAASPLIKKLRSKGCQKFFLTSTTRQSVSGGWKLGSNGDLVSSYYPLDLPEHYHRIMRTIRPDAVFVMEVDLWPNLVRVARERKIPVFLINGRISPKTSLFFRFFSPLSRYSFGQLTAAFTQTPADSLSLKKLGLDEKRIFTVGNIKYDISIPQNETHEIEEKFQQLTKGNTKIIIGGSTHKGEEEFLLDSVLQLAQKKPAEKIVLILAPRNISRTEGIVNQAIIKGFSVSTWQGFFSSDQVTHISFPHLIIIDLMGILVRLYGLSDVIYIGGSMGTIGGHNIIEGIQAAKPLCFGPDMRNFSIIAEEIEKSGCGKTVLTPDQACAWFVSLLDHPEEYARITAKLTDFYQSNIGVTDKILEHLEGYKEIFPNE